MKYLKRPEFRLAAALALFTVLAFQNCSRVEFASIAAPSSKVDGNEGVLENWGDGSLPENEPELNDVVDDELGEEAHTDKHVGHKCADGADGAIIYEGLPVDADAPNLVHRDVRGGKLLIERAGTLELDNIRGGSLIVQRAENVTVTQNIRGGHNAIVGRQIGDISDLGGGFNLFNALSIGNVSNLRGGAIRITANELGSVFDLRQGHLCVNVARAGAVTNVHGGQLSFIGRGTTQAVIPSFSDLRGGAIVISNVTSDLLDNVHAGVIIVRNSNIASINNVRGSLRLENSTVGSITDVRGSILSQGSSVGSNTNSVEIVQIP
ncbi:MAG: hypothetical protein NDI61_00380 [Bdellovibrionaceae bacterium]|nr:hypothetical protein [Pseudobdellovibrionaceae bacterium]